LKESFDVSFKVSPYLSLRVSFDIYYKVAFKVSYDVSLNGSCPLLMLYLSMFFCYEDLITAMQPSLSVYVLIFPRLCSRCDWVRIPPQSDVFYRVSACNVGGFFNKRARDTSAAKASLGAFPPILFAPRNKNLKLAVEFSKASRLFFHAAIYRCFDDFNHTNGQTVTLQNGSQMHMAKAIILAIYCDHPAARKCCLCGSACPQCFARQSEFANPPLPDTPIQMRTPGNVAAKQQVFFGRNF
jgi:hypothetical protein